MRCFFLSVFLLPSVLWASARDLGTLGGDYSFAREINSVGSVAGEAKNAEGQTHAFLWQNGIMHDLGTLPSQTFSMANALNNHDDVVGYGRSSEGSGATNGLLWENGGRPMVLPNLALETYGQASDINDRKEIVGVSGTKAVIWRNQKAKELPSLGGPYSIALGINNASWVVGNSLTPEGEVHATLWKNGKPIDLGTLGGRFSTANSINDQNQIVGSSETADGRIHAFSWQDGVMKDLGPGMIRAVNSLGICAGESPAVPKHNTASSAIFWDTELRPSSLEPLPGSVYSSAFSLNDLGFAVGVTEIRDAGPDSKGASGTFRATLWEPPALLPINPRAPAAK